MTTVAGLLFVPLKWLFGYFNPVSLLIIAVYVISIIKTPKIEEAEEEEEKESKITLKTAVILFVVFAVVLVAASIFLTYLTDGISEKYNLGASFGGALFLGVATSLPELTSTINLARKRNFQAAYSDLIGSCIFNFLILTFSDALSFDCRSSVYRFDQSAFMMIVFGAVEFIALLIGLILLIKGYGFKGGAMGISVAHDSHNIILLGDDNESLLKATNELRRIGGGMVIVDKKNGTVDSVELDVAGLMSSKPSEVVQEESQRLIDKAYAMGVDKNKEAFFSLTFLSLAVIPHLRLVDKGLFDVFKFDFVPLEAE